MNTRHLQNRLATLRNPLTLALAGLSLLTLSACGSVEPTTTPITQPTSTASQAAIPRAQTTWVPPTALVGTPRPGAVATLTAAPALKTGTLTILNADGQEVNIHVEIADTEPSREIGLMHRTTMDPEAGMIFDFGGETSGGFWMQNTLLPLSIAFIAADGTIVSISDMQPLDTNITEAGGTYSYALETNQGWSRPTISSPAARCSFP